MRYGAIINTAAIIVGGIFGLLFGKLIKENIKDTVIKGIGACTMFIGASGALAKIFVISDGSISTIGSVMMIVCMVLGAIVGEILDIDGFMERFGAWLKVKSGSAKDGGFIDAFVTTTLIVGVGAMGVVGSIQDGLTGDYSILLLKSVLDLITVALMTSAMGKGCIFSAVPVLILQGGLTILAGLMEPLMTEQALANISQVGNVMITMIGINMIRPKTFRAGNYLPALIFAVIWALIGLPMT
ncbi:MAG: DUF554 domain-containing protein [Lachnospiraceae bacterium]|nr:DUF554 domain-containing protein [Lachnospiraceae bacterium]